MRVANHFFTHLSKILLKIPLLVFFSIAKSTAGRAVAAVFCKLLGWRLFEDLSKFQSYFFLKRYQDILRQLRDDGMLSYAEGGVKRQPSKYRTSRV